jgi:anti-anti-sigma factor
MRTEINYVDVNENFRRISISGRLDILGTDEIELKFTSLAVANQRRVVVDLTAVSFLASIGIRALISIAKSLQQRGGKMVLFVGNNVSVTKTLHATGIDVLIPMFADTVESDKAALA